MQPPVGLLVLIASLGIVISIILFANPKQEPPNIEYIHNRTNACEKIANFLKKKHSKFEKHNKDWLCFITNEKDNLGSAIVLYEDELPSMIRLINLYNKRK